MNLKKFGKKNLLVFGVSLLVLLGLLVLIKLLDLSGMSSLAFIDASQGGINSSECISFYQDTANCARNNWLKKMAEIFNGGGGGTDISEYDQIAGTYEVLQRCAMFPNLESCKIPKGVDPNDPCSPLYTNRQLWTSCQVNNGRSDLVKARGSNAQDKSIVGQDKNKDIDRKKASDQKSTTKDKPATNPKSAKSDQSSKKEGKDKKTDSTKQKNQVEDKNSAITKENVSANFNSGGVRLPTDIKCPTGFLPQYVPTTKSWQCYNSGPLSNSPEQKKAPKKERKSLFERLGGMFWSIF